DYRDLVAALRDGLQAHEARDGAWGCEVIEALRPEPGDLSLVKTASGSFIGSSLDFHLRNAGIEHVLYTGVISHACVLLSVGEGFDLGYRGYFVSDATAAFTERLQEATEEIVSLYMAKVVSTDETIDLLEVGSSSPSVDASVGTTSA